MNIENFKYKLFGRFKGRKKTHPFLFNLLDRYKADKENKLNIKDYNILDIGSGSGENALHLAKNLPKSKIITCELFEDGNLNLCKKIYLNKIENISLFQGNVLQYLDEIYRIEIFDEVWVLFPDPWPKNRHHKRRLINIEFVIKIHTFLKHNGKLFVASDSQSYLIQILKTISEAQKFYKWKNQSISTWNYNNLNLPKTKFSEKALNSKRNSMFFELNKI